ncbi:UvrD-helicase domain-containing protein [Parachlamydia sp. AcF125]|uniref:ATP-dependent helicase n=1 Tax=Parachlamydia sp. AcF125 TaxID=2795736 RepID=UPI001BC8D793|nr:UvrD-helicase domain-containing protein [Parachlamydia sp. AcF125]MBS4167705.1 ATP-dependent DNA helicase PcrA [Parachlamydia sp. AcF125]
MQTLNAQQIRAVQALEGPFLVLAGAGSGKTRVVTQRIAHLIEEGISPSQILAVTFTNKAASEMQNRVKELTLHSVLISTFHSLGARILRESIHAFPHYSRNFVIYDEEDVLKVIKNCMEELHITDKKIEPKTFKHLISQAKNALKTPEQINDFDAESKAELYFQKVYAAYQSRMSEYNALDFDDLLFLTVRLFREHPEVLAYYQNRWQFLLIDEYQDTNDAQYAMVAHLVEKTHNLFVVGDPDQSIYSWRGAKIHNILNFEKDFPGAQVIHLEQNYRSRSNILEASNALINNNQNRLEKSLWSDRGAGEKLKLFPAETERFEASFIAEKIQSHREQGIPYNEMVVFYRTNFQSRVLEDTFLQNEIPYTIVGGISFYQRKEIKDILAFLRIANEPNDYISFARTINLPRRGIGDTTLEKIRVHAQKNGLSILDFAEALIEQSPLPFTFKLNQKQQEGLKGYLQVVRRLKEISENGTIQASVEAAIRESGYLGLLKEDAETFQDRKANLEELISKANEWEACTPEPSLAAFLEELSLKSTAEETDHSKKRVNLMTIHNGKGLEFMVVFLAGMEEDLFPHANSKGNFDALEEERRLCYVGMTRAKEYLYLTFARNRHLWGTMRSQRASRFLSEIPSPLIEKINLSQRHAPYRSAILEYKKIESAISMEEPVFLEAGDTIFHQEFGVGKIHKAYQGSIGLTYQIFFVKDSRERTLVAKYAKLKKL